MFGGGGGNGGTRNYTSLVDGGLTLAAVSKGDPSGDATGGNGGTGLFGGTGGTGGKGIWTIADISKCR